MSNTSIYIGDRALDLSRDTTVAQTLKRVNIGDLTTRSVNYTNSFKIPVTPNNNQIYQHANKVTSGTSFPYTKQNAKIIQGGIETMDNGIHNIRKAHNVYEVYILSNAADFFEQLGNKRLSDLDFTGLNGSWNNADIKNYRNNTSGIVAPVMDYGNFVPNDVTFGNYINVGEYLPSVYYHTVIENIIEQAGYDKSGLVFSDDKYNKLIIAYSRPEWGYDQTFVNDRYASAKVATPQSIPTPGAGVNVVFGETVIQDPKGFWNGSDKYDISDSDANASGKYLFLIDLLLSIDLTVAGGTVDINIINASNSVSLTNKGTGVYTINTKDTHPADFVMQEGDDTRITISTNSGTPAVTVNAGSVVFNPLNFVGTGASTFTYFNNLLPDMLQRDLIKDFLLDFGLIPTEAGQSITFKSLNEIIQDKANAKDWTNKRTNEVDEITFNPLGYAQRNYFKYSSQGDTFDHSGIELVINKDLGIGTFLVANENTVNEKTIYTSPFNNTLTELVGGIMMARVPINGLRNGFDNAPGLRKLLVRDKYSYESNVGYDALIPGESTYLVAYFESPDEANTMSYQQYLDDWYEFVITSLQRAKIVTRHYYLNELDIKGIDFLTPIFDQDSYYIINEVKNFVPGRVTEVELFKIT